VDWETRYQSGDTPWEKGAPSPGLVDWLAANQISGRVLVPGCGSGHDARVLAARGAHVIGIDIAPSAIRTASAFQRAADEQYILADLFNLPVEYLGAFDWVFEHTCFCAIDPALRPDYVSAVARTLKHGGHLLAVFYMTPDSDDGPPWGATKLELDALFNPHFDLLAEWVPVRAYTGREDRELMRLLRRKSRSN
jgi:SAM-dependent methyltransferase